VVPVVGDDRQVDTVGIRDRPRADAEQQDVEGDQGERASRPGQVEAIGRLRALGFKDLPRTPGELGW
jgi:hypothetical protein